MDLNKWTAIGKIKNKPVLAEQSGVQQTTFDLVVNNRAPAANGQWVDNFITVPCFARDRLAVAIAKNCTEGHEVAIEGMYVSWNDNRGNMGHAMKVLYISFGYKPKQAATDGTNLQVPDAQPQFA